MRGNSVIFEKANELEVKGEVTANIQRKFYYETCTYIYSEDENTFNEDASCRN